MRFLTIFLVLACCTSREKKTVSVQENTRESAALDVEEIHRLNKSANFFSSNEKKDTFILELRGQYITKSKIIFRIISFQNEVIYEDQFDMMALYGFGPDVTKPNPDSITVEKHLLERFENFFNSENFVRPAIEDDAKYDEDYNSIIPEEEWTQIKINPASIGFGFTLGEESISFIVFHDGRKKAVTYHVCC